jgi:hypothetical protein
MNEHSFRAKECCYGININNKRPEEKLLNNFQHKNKGLICAGTKD